MCDLTAQGLVLHISVEDELQPPPPKPWLLPVVTHQSHEAGADGGVRESQS